MIHHIKDTIMRHLLIAMLLLGSTVFTLSAQRFAYVDTEFILEKIPEYNQAQIDLDALAAQWKQQIEEKYQEIDRMYQKFQAEQYLMDESTRRRREQEIIDKEKEVKEYQKQKFGYEGELFQKRQELVKPIQDRVYNAIKDLAESRNYDFIFDKSSSGSSMLYANPRNDRSEDILKALGY